MKFPRGFLKGIVVGLVGAGLAVVGYFVFVYVALFVEFYAPPEPPPEMVEATIQNVFQQDLAHDWGAIEQIIGPESDYELQYFYLEYAHTGEIRDLYWTVQERQEDGSCEDYSIYWKGSTYEIYHINRANQGVCYSQPFMPLDQLWNVMTSDFIRKAAPQEPYDYALFAVRSETIEPSPDQDFFTWDGSQIQGPFKSGQGYFLEQYIYKSEINSGQKMFLIGGTNQ